MSSMNQWNSGDLFAQPLYGYFPVLERRVTAQLDVQWNATYEVDQLCMSKKDIVIIEGSHITGPEQV